MTNNRKSIIIILGVAHALPSNLNYDKDNTKHISNYNIWNTYIIYIKKRHKTKKFGI